MFSSWKNSSSRVEGKKRIGEEKKSLESRESFFVLSRRIFILSLLFLHVGYKCHFLPSVWEPFSSPHHHSCTFALLLQLIRFYCTHIVTCITGLFFFSHLFSHLFLPWPTRNHVIAFYFSNFFLTLLTHNQQLLVFSNLLTSTGDRFLLGFHFTAALDQDCDFLWSGFFRTRRKTRWEKKFKWKKPKFVNLAIKSL